MTTRHDRSSAGGNSILIAVVDHGQNVHGKRVVGVQAALREEGRISRLQSDALFDSAHNSAQQQRGTSKFFCMRCVHLLTRSSARKTTKLYKTLQSS